MSGDSRRDFITGRSLARQAEDVQERLAEGLVPAEAIVPGRGPTLLLQTTAMACHFDVILNPDGPATQLTAASEALSLVHDLEQQLSYYRADSEVSLLNRRGSLGPVPVEVGLFALLAEAQRLAEATNNAFDITSGPLIQLWRECRQAERIPTSEEIDVTRQTVGMERVVLDQPSASVWFTMPGVEINLGAIGKGYAVDRLADVMLAAGVNDWLIHGGKSSLLVRGQHAGHAGWPVGIRNPLFGEELLGTLVLKDAALSTSGTSVQWFRHGGKRYGHILDPRTGWPVDHLLGVSVVAPTAAMSDALSTAFFVLGVEKSLTCCDTLGVGALFVLPADSGRRTRVVTKNLEAFALFPAENIDVQSM